MPCDRVTKLWERGLQRILDGFRADGMRLLCESIAIRPTAEAHAYLGWALSLEERYEEAIEQCKIAIELDPQLGNPYNDIGAYLTELGREDEAVVWYERCKNARDYEHRQFPYLNLARFWIQRGELGRALLELQAAELLASGDSRTRMFTDRIDELLREREEETAPSDDRGQERE